MLYSRYATLILFLGILFPQASYAADPCAGVNQTLTKDLKKQYAPLIAKSLNGKVNPSKVDIDSIIQSGTWTIIYASTPIADPGYFFFNSSSGKPVFKDVWGGIAEKAEAPKIAEWARNLGANKTISTCFADTVTAD